LDQGKLPSEILPSGSLEGQLGLFFGELSIQQFFIIIMVMKKKSNSSFEEFEATSLYCPRCKTAVPVRKKLLLILPEGDEYEYLCVYCSSSVGMKIDKTAPPIDLILKP
jgi:hypothetical protein